jgi:GDPmannose 4,6-dehydratase
MTTRRVALICGISGQDGGYLAKLLLSKNYEVWGSSRDASTTSFTNLSRLGVRQYVKLISMVPEEPSTVYRAIKLCEPHEIYFLAGQSSVALSFEQPAETIRSITLGLLNLLEACRDINPSIRIYNAGSSECFGDTKGEAANEKTRFEPRSSYAIAKAASFWLVANYREAYNMPCCTGILFNHESPLRTERFVTRKIISAAQRIASGSSEKLRLGRLDIMRDWGWAPDYVEAMWQMLQLETVRDFVIATGKSESLETFVDLAFSHFKLNWRDHVATDPKFFRPTDISISRADPGEARQYLKWTAKYHLPDIVRAMANDALL